MRLPLPNLDDRRWSDLAEEGRNLVPRYATEWTDFNIHDPGIMLIELFAWVTEIDVYRVNRIPDSHRLKFLALLGITLQPPQAAQTVVQFSLHNDAAWPNWFGSPPAVNWVELPATIEVETTEADRPVRFRTLEAVTVVPAQLEALWREDKDGLLDLTTMWENRELLPMFGDVPRVGDIFYFGFSAPLPEGQTVAFYLRFAGDKSGKEERQRLQEELRAGLQDCLPLPNPCLPENYESPAELTRNLLHHSVRTVWEFAQLSGNTISWRSLSPDVNEVSDDTLAFTLNGFVRFRLPAPIYSVSLSSSDSPRYYLRCRLAAGEYDAPPILQAAFLNAAPVEQAVPVSSEFAIATNAIISYPPGSPPSTFGKFTLRFNAAGEIAALSFLAPEAEAPEFFITRLQLPAGSNKGLLGCELRLIDRGLGEPFQKVVLEPVPVQSHSVEIFTLEDEAWYTWIRRPDFDASSRDDRHFLLDETTGTVTFGDGERGLPAPGGALIFARYRTTLAAAGNILPEKISRLSNSAHNQSLIDVAAARAELKTISNPFPATGGADAETLAHAEGRALEEVNRVTRAVTVADIEHLALTTPGANVARVAVKTNLDARYPCLQAPGTTTVILLPQISAPRVQPSSGLRVAVKSYLNRRHILGNRIEVVGPVYTKVTVQARVQSQTGTDAARVQQDIMQALDDFFDPLRGGPEKTGWPFGRDVYRSEVLHTIDNVSRVENVVTLELIANDGEPSCGNLCIGPCGLVVSGEHEIVVE